MIQDGWLVYSYLKLYKRYEFVNLLFKNSMKYVFILKREIYEIKNDFCFLKLNKIIFWTTPEAFLIRLNYHSYTYEYTKILMYTKRFCLVWINQEVLSREPESTQFIRVQKINPIQFKILI